MKQILFCFFACATVLFSCDAMDKKKPTSSEQKKPVNSPRRLSPLASPRANIPFSSMLLEFDATQENGIYIIPLGNQNFREIPSDKKKKKGQKNNQEAPRVLVLDQHELGPLVAYIKEREGFFSAEQMKEKEEKIISLGKQISYLDSSATINMRDTRTFAEKNVVQIGILGFAAGVVLVSGVWFWQSK